MIRVRYSDGRVEEYKNVEIAKLMVVTERFSSRGEVTPIVAADVMGKTTEGIPVERDLDIVAGEIQYGWDA
jgi:hypothetical protein